MVGIGLAATGYALSRVEWRNEKRKSSITKSHKKFFGV